MKIYVIMLFNINEKLFLFNKSKTSSVNKTLCHLDFINMKLMNAMNTHAQKVYKNNCFVYVSKSWYHHASHTFNHSCCTRAVPYRILNRLFVLVPSHAKIIKLSFSAHLGAICAQFKSASVRRSLVLLELVRQELTVDCITAIFDRLLVILNGLFSVHRWHSIGYMSIN